MAVTQEYLSLQGSSHLAKNVNGVPVALRELGNQTSVQLKISTDSFDIKESKTGKRGTIKTVVKERHIELEMKLDEQKRADIALAFQAEPVKTEGKPVVDEKLTTLKVGEEAKLGGFNLSELGIKDSTQGGAITLEKGVHYEADLQAGVVKLLKTDGITQPLLASYTVGATESNVFFSLPDGVDYYYLFKGINSLDNRRVMVELWKFQPVVDSTLDLINDELGEITIKGSANLSESQSSDPTLGAFGRIVYLD